MKLSSLQSTVGWGVGRGPSGVGSQYALLYRTFGFWMKWAVKIKIYFTCKGLRANQCSGEKCQRLPKSQQNSFHHKSGKFLDWLDVKLVMLVTETTRLGSLGHRGRFTEYHHYLPPPPPEMCSCKKKTFISITIPTMGWLCIRRMALLR